MFTDLLMFSTGELKIDIAKLLGSLLSIYLFFMFIFVVVCLFFVFHRCCFYPKLSELSTLCSSKHVLKKNLKI